MILVLVLYLAGLGTPDPPQYKVDVVVAPSMAACEEAKISIEAIKTPPGRDVVVFCIDLRTT